MFESENILLLLVLGVALFINIIKARYLLNPVIAVVSIWLFWLTMANFSLGGVSQPSLTTQNVLIIGFIAFLTGSLFATSRSCTTSEQTRLGNEQKIFLGVIASVPFLFYLLGHAANEVVSEGLLTAFANWFSRENPITIGGYIGQIYRYFLLSFVWAAFFIGLAQVIKKRKKMLFFSSVTIIFFIEIVGGSRNGIVLVFITSIFAYLYCWAQKNRHKAKKKWVGPSVVFLVLFFTLFYASIERAPSMYEGHGLKAVALHYGVNYHTVNFAIFDQVITQGNYLYEDGLTLGAATTGWLGQLVEPLGRRIDGNYESVQRGINRYNNEKVHVGYRTYRGQDAEPLEMNAFYGLFYLPYQDGRVPGIVLFCLVFGFLAMRAHVSWLKHRDEYSLALVALIFCTAYSMLTNPLFTSTYFWPVILLLFIYGNVRTGPPVGLSFLNRFARRRPR